METNNIIPVETQRQINHIAEVCKRIKPLVVIKSITYNHENYLRDALEGFVMQKTDFPFVAVVHDDASTDGTAAILREYAEKYPDIILPIFETENQYSKRDGSLGRVLRAARETTGVKYVALCEGDDYWIVPDKLQRQVDFLESHPDYSMVFSDASIMSDFERHDDLFNVESRNYTQLEIYKTWVIPTCTMVFHNKVYESDSFKAMCKIKKPLFGDITLQLCCGSIGKIYGMSDITAVYRQLESGATKAIIGKNYYRFMLNRIAVSNYFGKEFKDVDRQTFSPRFLLQLSRIRQNFLINLKYCARLFWFAPKQCGCQLLSIPAIVVRHLLRRYPK